MTEAIPGVSRTGHISAGPTVPTVPVSVLAANPKVTWSAVSVGFTNGADFCTVLWIDIEQRRHISQQVPKR
jgi:hypothetical protein